MLVKLVEKYYNLTPKVGTDCKAGRLTGFDSRKEVDSGKYASTVTDQVALLRARGVKQDSRQ